MKIPTIQINKKRPLGAFFYVRRFRNATRKFIIAVSTAFVIFSIPIIPSAAQTSARMQEIRRGRAQEMAGSGIFPANGRRVNPARIRIAPIVVIIFCDPHRSVFEQTPLRLVLRSIKRVHYSLLLSCYYIRRGFHQLKL